jgi:uncharacterized protein (DUF169 family)
LPFIILGPGCIRIKDMDFAASLRPVAIAFSAEPPSGLSRWEGPAVPAGCAFWSRAQAGAAFYTEPADHYHCAVGSHTHGLALPVELGPQLMNTVGFMVESGYLRMEEVPGIPVLPVAPRYVSYAPAATATFTPDVVLFAAPPAAVMLLYEAALRSGAGTALTPSLGRPGCAVLPLAANSGAAALSLGCRGNRTFTGLPHSDLYFAVPGRHWPSFEESLAAIVAADMTMAAHYQRHQALFPIVS